MESTSTVTSALIKSRSLGYPGLWSNHLTDNWTMKDRLPLGDRGGYNRLRWSSQLSNMDTIPSVGGVSTPAAKRDIRCLSRQSKE